MISTVDTRGSEGGAVTALNVLKNYLLVGTETGTLTVWAISPEGSLKLVNEYEHVSEVTSLHSERGVLFERSTQ